MAKGEKSNGQGPQIQRREEWVELPEAYAGFKFRVWLNAPSKLWNKLSEPTPAEATDEEQAALEKQRQEVLQKLVLAHNGWRDYDGEEFPPASEAAFWQEIPTELAGCMITAAALAMQNLPNSMRPRRRR